MTRLRQLFALVAWAALSGLTAAQPPESPTLATARGEVAKVGRDSVVIKPRGADGRFEKELTLHVTGTTKVSVVTMQTRGGKPVSVQQDTDVRELRPQQPIAVIYVEGPSGAVLLSAVALPSPAK